MKRLFSEHVKRRTESLDGTWHFSIDNGNVGLSEEWYRTFPVASPMFVPSVWGTSLGLLDYQGVAWYKRDFYSREGTVRIHFGAVMTSADVWLDGVKLGSHYGGFCEFDFITKIMKTGNHTLTVRVDNSVDELSIPGVTADWYRHGGIIRSVTLEHLSGLSILSNHMCYDIPDDLSSVSVRFDVELYNPSDLTISSRVRISIGDLSFMTPAITVASGERRHLRTDPMTLGRIGLWSPDNPVLYRLVTETETDDLIDRVGFRKVTATPDGIRINGMLTDIRGVNRHEECTECGFAFPEAMMSRDLDIIADLGCNAIRGSHYPNSRPFLDMLDERGFLFWSEIPMWGTSDPETLANPLYLERGKDMLTEMVKHYYNHPSIIFWSMHNEIATDTDDAVSLTAEYFMHLREIGGSRLITYATNRPLTDRCLAYCDVISLNQYFGWYGSDDPAAWDDFLRDFRARRAALGLSDKPVIMSEFGAAAVYGHRTFDNLRWSEDYQASLLTSCLEKFHVDPMITGSFVWHFADIRTSQGALDRARGYNNKALLNEYRAPKAAYFAVRELYNRYAREATSNK